MKTNIKDLDTINGTINIGISAENLETVTTALATLLADEHVLYIKLRNYHWNVTGIHFQPLHALFEEQYTLLANSIDEIAERIRSLGFFTPGSLGSFQSMARLEESGHLNGNAEAMLNNLLKDHEAIIRILRKDVEVAENANDAGTADFLTALMEEHEKMAWMLRAHLA
jgi:starvation-inducible DNA-binding protein